MKQILVFVALSWCFVVLPARADLEIFTCESEWASLAQEIGGDKVKAFSATTPFQDVHFVQARPSLLARVRRADLVVCTGANLEIGWLPLLLRQSGNASVNVGTKGFLEAAQYVQMLDVPASADRTAGDVHPYGNPHIQTDPRNILKVAAALSARLQELDPDNALVYRKNFDAFQQKWNAALARWAVEAASLKGTKIAVHHSAWIYMEDWLGLVEIAQMEPKPGLPPTASHLAGLVDVVKSNDVKLFVLSAYQAPRAADWLTDHTGVPSVVIPHTVGATDAATDLVSMFDDMIRRLKGVQL